ncbi:MAG: hypothetical protein JST87_13670 [Bacteroidetes bacterium]|nr:hypothetical protein [Bacteroidota bacterium]
MKSNYLSPDQTYHLLHTQESIILDLCFLPKGRFRYSFAVTNPDLNYEPEILATLFTGEKKIRTREYVFAELRKDEIFEFEITDNNGCRDAQLQFQLIDGYVVKLFLQPSPILIQKNIHLIARINEIEEKINFEINNFSYHHTTAEIGNTELQVNTAGEALDKTHIQSFIHSRYFRGLLSTTDAEKQLEYVVYNKLFLKDQNKGFRKWKLKFYRKSLILFYRMMAKNTNRKRYFARLYRNYVNMNLIADNLFDQ